MEKKFSDKIKTTAFDNVVIAGYETDYVFQRIAHGCDYYEGDILRKWTALLGKPQYIVDVGANLGNHTVYWAKHLDVKGIFSFEPFPENYRMLQQNVRENHLDCVTTINLAVGESAGRVEVLAFDPENYGGTTFQYTDRMTDTVNVCSLDAAVSEFNIPRVDFVKIDTEGFELSVLKGMKGILQRDRPALWIEAGKDTIVEIYEMLKNLNYWLVDIASANFLFIQAEKASIPRIGIEQVLENILTLLEKVNVYYSNYEKYKNQLKILDEKLTSAQQAYQTSKGWLEQRNEELQRQKAYKETLVQQMEDVREKLKAYQQNYETCKEWLANRTKEYEDCKRRLAEQAKESEAYKRRLEKREEQLDRLKNAKLDEQLLRCIQEQDQSIALLIAAKKEIQRLQAQNAYLKTENENYARKFAKITSTWYGNFALNCYHKLQKSKWRAMAFVRKIKKKLRGEKT